MNPYARRLFILALAALAGWSCQPARESGSTQDIGSASEDPLSIVGRILTADGQPAKLAHVYLSPLVDPASKESVEAGVDGSFELTAERGAALRLSASALHHKKTSLPLVLNDETHRVELELTLKPQSADADTIRIVGADIDSDMERRDDGTFVYVAEQVDEKLSYKIRVGGFDGPFVHGTQADEYEPDDKGGYDAVIQPATGPVEIVFDPSQLPTAGDVELPRLKTEESALAQVFAIEQEVSYAGKAWKELMRTGEEPDWGAIYASARDKILPAIASTESSSLRSYAAASTLSTPSDAYSEEERQRAFDELSAESPYWALVGFSIQGIDAEKHAEVLEALRTGHPSADVRAMALAALIRGAKKAEDKARWQELYAELKTFGDEVPSTSFLLKSLNPESNIEVGKTLPDFQLALFESEFQGTDTVSKSALSGSVYLIDFWGTWCAPCVAEIPKIHEVWEKYKDRNFQILSVAVENSPEIIRNFRRDEHEMPWLHHYVEENFEGEILKTFEVSSYPKPILVGADGTVVATATMLRGEELMTQVAKAMGD